MRTYGEQSIIALQVKRSSFDTYIGQLQWAFVELELVTSHLEWGPTLEPSVRDGMLWVVSAAQEYSPCFPQTSDYTSPDHTCLLQATTCICSVGVYRQQERKLTAN